MAEHEAAAVAQGVFPGEGSGSVTVRGNTVRLPDRVAGQRWLPVAELLAADPARRPVSFLPGPAASCRCGEASVGQLLVRQSDGKVLCVGCSRRPIAVRAGDRAVFRLADSDLYSYVDGARELVGSALLRGVVEQLLVRSQEVTVRVEGWSIPHTVDVAALVERPAGLEDMRRAWPDKSDDELRAAAAQIMAADAFLVVVPGDVNSNEETK